MFKKTIFTIVLTFIAIQFIPIEKSNPKVDEKIALTAPKNVMNILKTSCYDCHSYETKWPYYSDIAPISWVVSSHVKKARKAFNFSEWRNIETSIKEQRLKRAIITVNNEMMALPSYLSAHKEAKLNKDEKTVLTSWFKQELENIK